MKRILFIINPNSGKKKTENIRKAISKQIDLQNHDVSIMYSKYAGHAIELSKEAVVDNMDVVVAVGGDGTVNEIASQLVNTNTILGIVPLGSGNGLARHLGIPRNIKKSVEIISNSIVTKIDTATINNKFFTSIAGIGFDAMIADKFAKGKTRGFTGYFNLIINEYFRYNLGNYTLSFNDKPKSDHKALFIAFANSNQFGYSTTIAPSACLTDGLLDVCIVRKPKFLSLPRIAMLLFSKKIGKSSDIQIVKAGRISVTRENEDMVNIDGEPILMENKLDIRVNPLSLKIILDKKNVGKI